MRTAVRVGYCFDRLFLEHDAGAGHPERPERLDAVNDGLNRAGLLDVLRPLAARPATRDELLRVHAGAHVDRIAASAGRRVRFDADTATSPRSSSPRIASRTTPRLQPNCSCSAATLGSHVPSGYTAPITASPSSRMTSS